MTPPAARGAGHSWPRSGVLLLTCGLLLSGCRESSSTATGDTAAPAAPTVDPLAGAPADWPAFLTWAREQISAAIPPKPMPSPTLPLARWAVIHLEERLEYAAIDCAWKRAEGGAASVLALGPLRSDQPGPNLSVQQASDALGLSTWLLIRGFKVDLSQVGGIEIECSQPGGDTFELMWSQAGRITVPVPGPDQMLTYRIAADGLPEWGGVLEQLRFRVPATGPGVIEIRSLRFVPRTAAFPSAVAARRVAVGHESRHAIYAHSPATIRFENLALPRNARLQTGVAQVAEGNAAPAAPAAAAGVATTFEVLVEADGQTTSVLSQHVDRGERWLDVSASLEPWSGKTITLILRASATADGTIACWGAPVIYESVADPPILMVYLIDTLAAEHVDLYGYPRPTMPRLRSLAEQGVWFARMFSTSSRTIESIPDLMTGLPTEQHGIHHPSMRLPQAFVTLPEAMRLGGFATASFCTNVNAGPRQSLDQGFDHFFDHIAFWWSVGEQDRTVPIEEILAWLKDRADRPTFLYVHTAEPHAPYTPPKGFSGKFDPDYRGEYDGTYDKQTGFQRVQTKRDLEHIIALYDEEIHYADTRLGMFVDALRDVGALARVTMLITADHGEQFFQHGSWEHGDDLHNEMTRVPLVAFGPLVTARGKQDEPVKMYDLMPTVLGLAGLPVPYELAGESLAPLLAPGGAADAKSRASLRARSIFLSNHAHRARGVIEHAVIAEGRWKLMYRFLDGTQKPAKPLPAEQRFALFDLQTDLRETQDVLAANQPIARRLIGQLLTWLAQRAPLETARREEGLDVDLQQIEELKALGYVEAGEPTTMPAATGRGNAP